MNNTPIISKEDMAKLLGRSLTDVEDKNYNLYLDITVERLQDLLCLTEIPDPLPLDLQLLIARLFGIIVVEQRANLDNIQSKKVEDFSVTYDNNSTETPMSKFININQVAIAKYSQCQGAILHGRICDDRFRFI